MNVYFGGDMKERVKKKRETIISTSRELFAINGFENTKVEDITKAMNISKGSFYTYFKTKEEVLFEVMEKAYVEYEEILSTIDKHQDQKDIMKDFFKKRKMMYRKYGNIREIIIKLLLSEEPNTEIIDIKYRFVNLSIEFIKDNIVKKYNRKDIDVDFISDFIEVSVEGYFMKKTRFPNVKDSVKETIFTDEVFEKIIKFIDDSLSKK